MDQSKFGNLHGALKRKWKMVVDEWVEAQAANSGDKISDDCRGDAIFVSDGPLDLHQEHLTDSFLNGGFPATPSCTPLDLLKLYDDVDDKRFFSILQHDDAFPAMENVNKEQDSNEKPSLTVKELVLNLPENTEVGPKATPDRNGVQSPLEKEPLDTHDGLQASQEHADFRNELQAECYDIRSELESSSFDTHNRIQLHQTNDLGERVTSECDWKGRSIVDVQQQLGKNKVNTSQKTVEGVVKAKQYNGVQSKLKSSSVDTHKMEQLNETDHLGKRKISVCDRKGKGAIDVQHQLKQNTVNSLHVSIERSWQAKECKDIQPKRKSGLLDTHKRAQLNETSDLEQRITSQCDCKAKGATKVRLQLKQRQPKQNKLYGSDVIPSLASHQDKL